MGELSCPSCGSLDRLKRHAVYTKYYYGEQITILRVICRQCGTTHALIPSFSLPGTSGGTEEVEGYLKSRHDGIGRGRAGKVIQDLGVSERYGVQVEKMFARSIDRAKALFPQVADGCLDGMDWVRSVVKDFSRPLYSLNCFCLRNGVNAVCFCRISILRFHPGKSGRRFSHNIGRPQPNPSQIPFS